MSCRTWPGSRVRTKPWYTSKRTSRTGAFRVSMEPVREVQALGFSGGSVQAVSLIWLSPRAGSDHEPQYNTRLIRRNIDCHGGIDFK